MYRSPRPRGLVRLAVLLLASACASSTSPQGDVRLTRDCATIDVQGGSPGSCVVRISTAQSATATIGSVVLIGFNGQPTSVDNRYGGNLGLRFYPSPAAASLAGQTVGPGEIQVILSAVVSIGEGETSPAPGTYPASIRVTVTPAGGSASTLEVSVPIRVM